MILISPHAVPSTNKMLPAHRTHGDTVQFVHVTSQSRRPRPRDLTGFEVIVDDGGFDFVEVPQSADDLHDNGARLLLRHQLVLLQVEVQVVAFAELQNSAEPGDGPTHSYDPGAIKTVTDQVSSTATD